MKPSVNYSDNMIKEISIRVLPQQAASETALKGFLAREFALNPKDIQAVRILKRSIDARKRQVIINLTVRIYLNELPPNDMFSPIIYGDVSDKQQAIVVGAGPAGLFAALRLIELGMRPIVLERGKDVHQRRKDIARISREHKVDSESNYCFGEGGAGAFSDGKLYTRSKKRGSVDRILSILCQHGASLDILADAHPHIGTDKLPRVIENIRHTILESGGEVKFGTRIDELIFDKQEVIGAKSHTGDIFPGPVILATGHSARDVYYYLHRNNIELEAKGFAVGVRLEHPQELIDRMCPGGIIVPAASGPNQLVVNGMSPSNRGSRWANSVMVVEIRPEDIPGYEVHDVLAGIKFQEEIEYQCFINGNCRQTAPAQRMTDFINGKISPDLPITSYTPGVISSPLHFWMPTLITERLRQGFRHFGKISHGFLTREALMIGVETRTSSPVRIPRDSEQLHHIRFDGLYPCGEGAGYAGGIVSAAIDGERCAEALAYKYLKLQ